MVEASDSLKFNYAKTTDYKDADYVLFGVPFDSYTIYRPGSRFGPNTIRVESYNENLSDLSETGIKISDKIKIYDAGNIPVSLHDFSWMAQNIKNKLTSIASLGKKFILLGGDHSITIPVGEYLNTLEKRFSVIYFDAHLDFFRTYWKNKNSPACVLRRISEQENFDPQYSIVFGARCWTKEQIDELNRCGIRLIPGFYYNFEKTINLVVDYIQEAKRRKNLFYLTFDIDVFDPSVAPGVSHPVPGGRPAFELFYILKLLASIPIIGFDVTEFNPSHDLNGITAHVAIKVIVEIIASQIVGDHEKIIELNESFFVKK